MTGAPVLMIGTANQVELAEQIRPLVDAEFDRVADAFRAISVRQTGQRRADTVLVLKILEDQRLEVMAHKEAGYFIRDWRELNDQVRRLIRQDPRYDPIRTRRQGNL